MVEDEEKSATKGGNPKTDKNYGESHGLYGAATDPYSQMKEVLEILERDQEAGISALGYLADRGSVEAMINLGVIYQAGRSVPKDLHQAEACYRRALDNGSAKAMFYIGGLYLEKKDYEGASAMFAQGAARGNKDCGDQLEKLKGWQRESAEYNEVHELLLRQKTNGVEVREELQVLAEKHSLRAMVALGWTYWKGLGTSVDLRQAEYWYGRACEESKGCGRADREAAYKCGDFYLQQHRYDMAYVCFQRGAALEHVRCLRMAARMQINGLGVDKDLEKGKEYLERAAIEGNVFAKRDLARLFMSGGFGWKNRIKGWRMFLHAIREGFRIARYNPKDERLED